jgi:hypothetical protein
MITNSRFDDVKRRSIETLQDMLKRNKDLIDGLGLLVDRTRGVHA